jgi:prepilin-type N-terminal cleavage/methylation domain-containing protein
VRPLSKFLGEEGGLTLVEILVVVVIAGGVAAIALPSFRHQESKGTDSEAKSAAVMAAKTMEACAADNGGSFQSCSKEALVSMEPGLADADDRLTVVAGSATYEIGVMSKRDPSVSFTVSKASDGTTSRTCSTNEDRGGCQVPKTGTW